MKKALFLFGLLSLCACVYEVPLIKEAVIPVDPSLSGTWQLIPEDGSAEEPDGKMVVLPFSANEYVVICSSGRTDQMVFRAYPIRVDDMKLVQLEWLQPAPTTKDRYHVCRYTLTDGVLAVEVLNDKVVGSEIDDSQALRETLLANRANPELFRVTLHYRKLSD